MLSPIPENLSDLTDVAIATPTAGHALVYNGTRWANAAVAVGDISGLTTALAGKLDVTEDGIVAIAEAGDGIGAAIQFASSSVSLLVDYSAAFTLSATAATFVVPVHAPALSVVSATGTLAVTEEGVSLGGTIQFLTAPSFPVTSISLAALNASGTRNSTTYLRGDGTWATVSGGSGTVSSVALSVPSWLSVSGSPVTTSGTLAVTAATGQAANQVLATPNGSTGAVSLRSLVAADVPSLTSSKISDFQTTVSANTDVAASTAARHSALTIGTANGLSLSTQQLSLATAVAGVSAGAMSAADKTKLDGIAAGATANTGTVTSVALSVPSWLSVSGSPVTTSGTLAVTAATSQTANQVLATPDGTTGAVSLRSLVAADIASGTFADARLSSNVALRNAANAFTAVQSVAPTNSAASGSTTALVVAASYSQSGGTTANTDLLVNRNGTTGSGTQRLLDLQLAGVSQFAVASDGTTTLQNTLVMVNTGTARITGSGDGVFSSIQLQNANQITAVVHAGVKVIGGMSDYQFVWRSVATGGFFSVGSIDTGLARHAAGVVRVTDGSTGTGSLRCQDATILGAAAVTGAVTAASFSGSGASLTSLDAGNLATGTVSTARLGSGTANSTTYLRGDGTWATPAGAGTVTSVAMTVPSWLSVAGSPITGSGSLDVTAAAGQAANRILATPDGTTGAVSLRALVAADVPNLDAGKITTGTMATARLGSGTANSTTFLRGDQTYAAPYTYSTNATPVTANANVTTAQTLMSYTVAAGAINAAGRTIEFRGAGVATVSTTATVTISVALGSVVIASWTTASITATQTNMPWSIEGHLITVGTGASGTVESAGMLQMKLTGGAGLANSYLTANTAVSSAIDLTASQNLTVRVTFSANAASANTCTERTLLVRIF